MKFSHIWKAWLSTLVGILLPIVTGIVTDAFAGQVDWTAVKASLAPAAVLLVTNLFKEGQKALEDITDTTE